MLMVTWARADVVLRFNSCGLCLYAQCMDHGGLAIDYGSGAAWYAMLEPRELEVIVGDPRNKQIHKATG